jgi:hypothetical protein
MKNTILSFDKYKSYKPHDRALYLNDHVENTTDLLPDFCIKALKWETYPIAKWYLIKAVGILKLKSSIPLLLEICRMHDEKFNDASLHLITAWSFGKLGEYSFKPIIEEFKKSKNFETKKCIIDALGEIGNPKAIDILTIAFKEKDDEIKLWAALSLAKIGKKSLNTLYYLYNSINNLKDKILILDAILKINDNGSKIFIKDILSTGSFLEKKFILMEYSNYLDSFFKNSLVLITKSESLELSEMAKKCLKNISPSIK